MTLLGLVATEARADPRPNLDAYLDTAAPARPQRGPGVVVSTEPGRGAPALLWTPAAATAPAGLAPEAAARLHLEHHRHSYGVGRAAIAGARLRFVHDTGRGGIIVALRSTVGGIDVFHGDVKVLLDRQGRPLAISGAPHPAAQPGSARPFVRSDATAVLTALRDLTGAGPSPRIEPAAGPAGWTYFGLAGAAPGLRMRVPARVRPVYYPLGDALVPAHFVELQVETGRGLEVVQYVLSADDGRLLHRRDATAYEAYQYRVWADADGDHRPADGPMEDFTPYPTDVPGEGPQKVAEPALIAMEGFNTNPDGLADPWLPPGATETRGNNIDAYVDHNSPDGLDDSEFRATVTAPGIFDRVYDVLAEPLVSQAQSMAAITQLFYVTNWLHDDWYDSGFNEAAGNAQADNFGRGGKDGDPLHAEAQDAALGGARNNANMSTPSDGASPTMQMYLWTGLTTTATLHLDPLDQDFEVGLSQFGPLKFDVTAPIVVIEDAGGKSPSDGCEAPINDLAGKIVLIDRGDCTFETKVEFAEAAGAVGVIIADNAVGGELNPGNDTMKQDPTIPTQGTSKSSGAALKAAIELTQQTAHMVGDASVERDGTIDNGIVAHEWGHYLHHRLTQCGSRGCSAQSEGWGDFTALHMMLRAGDDMHGAFSGTTYANFDAAGYFGIRRVPYSVDFAKNALTYRHIADGADLPVGPPIDAGGIANSEVHNAGEIWATMMWEAYVALHEEHKADLSFAQVRDLMADYVVAGMMLAPVDPTFLEQRDALLMAAAARDPRDFDVIAAAFARRGAGSCAVSPDRNSSTFVGVVEDFQLRANGVMLAAAVSDAANSCDEDGVIDIGELGRVDVELYNAGTAELPAGARVEVIDPDPALMFPDGATVELPALAPLTRFSVSIPVSVGGLKDYRPVTINLRLTTPGGCSETSERPLRTVIQADLNDAAAAHDDVEAEPSAWNRIGNDADVIWRREASEEDGFYWHADDVGRTSDTRLQSPKLEVAEGKPLVIGFDHAYSFETSEGTFWDGAVIELSRDGGATWEDISKYTSVAYPGTINSEANPLHSRQAFVGASAGYPARQPVSLDLGDQLAGETVMLRLRVGTDAAAGGAGWDIDNFRFEGLTNTPFPRWTRDEGGCDEPEGTGSGDEGSGEPTTTVTPTDEGDDDGGLGSASDTASTSGGDDGPSALDDDGCGCTTDANPPGRGSRGLASWSWVLLLALTRRRRAR